MTDAERILIEGNLAHKWSLTSVLPSAHAHKSTAPTVGGWAIERGASGQNDITLDLTGAGGQFTQPTTIDDGDWHHLSVTFGSGNKKIYIDGNQIGTASQSGSVTDSALKLILGDPDPFGSVATRAKVDDVRFYRGVLTADEVSAIHNDRAGDIGAPKFALTSPSTLAGSNGRSVSYQISANPAHGLTGYNSSISYSLLNAPSWLSVGSTSGLVTGTPPTSGTYNFQVRAVNTLGSNVQDVSLTVADFTNWDYSLSFTTDFNGGTPLKDWNMLVRLSEDNSTGPGSKGFRYSQCSANGGDLRFIDKDGQELFFEIANWNTAGESQVWVRTPTLKSDANVTMFWGNPSAGLPSYANNGSAWNDYFGVYHLEQSTGPATDSSPSGNDLSAINAPVLNSSGLTGTAYSTTASAENGFLSNALNGSIKAKDGTYTIWAKTPSNPADEKDWFGVQYNNDPNYVLRLESSTSSPPTTLVNSSFDFSTISGLKLWLDASSLSSIGSTWSDLSGNNNHATKTGSPTLRTNAYNGKAVIDYNGSNSEYHSFTRISDIRTVFLMLARNDTSNQRFILGDTSTYHFHTNGNTFFHSSHAHTNVKNGLLKVNGSTVNGTSTGMPSSLSVVSLRTLGNVQANNFSNDRNNGGRTWAGELAELLIYNQPLNDNEIAVIEGQLAHKWGTSGSLDSNHPYRFNQPGGSFAGLTDPNDNVGTGNWQMLTLSIKDGKMNLYVDGVQDGTANKWYFLGKDFVTGLSLGRGSLDGGPDAVFDEATFSTVGRSSSWISASFNNQKPNSSYLNFGTLVGPPSLNDDVGTKVFAKKDTAMSYTVGFSGSGTFVATGLPPGLSINSATGEISGSTSVTGSQTFTVTATGATAGGGTETDSFVYTIVISDPASFPFRMNLTLSGYTGSSTLKEFPVLVDLNESSISGFAYNSFLDSDADGIRDGGDLRFFASNGKELPYEIADWNVTGTSNIWVKVPSISGTNTVVTAAWGKSGTEVTPDYATDDPVWAENFGGVWHFSSESTLFPDSSPNSNHATRNSVAVSNSSQIGRGASFTGTEFADVAFSESLNTENFTISIWAKRASGSGTGYRSPFTARQDQGSGLTYGFMVYSQAGNYRFWTGKGVSGGSWHTSPTVSHSDNTWDHIAITHDGSSKKIWKNGSLSNTASGNPLYGENFLYGLRIGAGANENPTGEYFWSGELDEMRHSSVARSADWIEAEFDNQKSSGTKLVSYGSVTGPRIITSPLYVDGTYGQSFSYNLTASGSPSGYTILNLPDGLTFVPATGAVSGTPTQAGTFPATLVVDYSDDDGDITDSDSLNDRLGNVDGLANDAILLSINISPLAPTIATLAANAVGPSYANFEGNVTNSGGLPPEVKIYYGTSDGANDPNAWTTVKNIGNQQSGVFSIQIGDLSPGNTYYYRARATHSGGDAWANSSKSFTTQTSTNPIAGNGPVQNATGTSAKLIAKIANFGTGTVNFAPRTLSASEFPGITLWVDGADTNSITKVSGTNEVSTWTNKIDSTVKLHGHATNKPDTGASINGLNAITFDKRSNSNMEHIIAKKGNANWNPAGSNGAASGSISDVVVMLVGQFDTVRRSNFPFNFGWGDHLPWSNGYTYWRFDGGRAQIKVADANVPFMLCYDFSVTKGRQIIFNNGTSVYNKPRSNVTNIGGAFKFPDIARTGGNSDGTEWTLGEMMVVRGTMTDQVRRNAEGYLAHKWGLVSNLPLDHPWANIGPYEDTRTGIDLTLYWGSSDGGENANTWDNEVNIGKIAPKFALWYDASDASTLSLSSGNVTTWNDKSGNARHATTSTGDPAFSATDGPNGMPVVQFRSGAANGGTGDEEMNINGTFKVKEHFYVVRSPSENWSDYGGIIGNGAGRERVITCSSEIKNISTATSYRLRYGKTVIQFLRAILISKQ